MIQQNFNSGDVSDLADYSENGVGWSSIAGQLKVQSGSVRYASGTDAFAAADYDVGSDDMECSADCSTITSAICGVMARVDIDAGTGYVFYTTGAAGQWRIGRLSGGAISAFEFVSHSSPPASGELKITCVGTTITGYVDGVQVAQATDANISEGQCGGLFGKTGTTLDNFSARSVSFNSIADASPMFAPLQDDAASTAVVVYEDGAVGTAATLAGGDNTADITTTGPGSGFAKALDLDGAADTVDLGTALNAILGSGDYISMAAWFNGTLADSLIRQVTPGYVVLWHGATNDCLVSTDGGTNGVPFGTAEDSTWHFLSMSRDTNGDFATYLDGSPANARASNGSSLPAMSGKWYIGSSVGSLEFTNGAVASAIVSPAVWSDDEHALLYAGPALQYSTGATLSADGTFDVGTYSLPYGLSGTNSLYDNLDGDANLLAWYTGTGSTADDASGNGNDGTWAGTEAYADGVMQGGKKLSLDGSSYVIIPDGAALGLAGSAGAFTFALRFTATGVTGKQVLMANGGGTNGQTLYLDGDKVYANIASNSVSFYVASDTQIQAGVAYTVVAVFDVDNDLTLYVQGEQDGTPTALGSIDRLHAGTNDGAIGAVYQDTKFHDVLLTSDGAAAFTGTIEDAMILDRALSAAEVLSHHNAQSRYTARLRGPDGAVVETLTANGLTTGGFSDTLYNLGGAGVYKLETLVSNDGGTEGWEQVATGYGLISDAALIEVTTDQQATDSISGASITWGGTTGDVAAPFNLDGTGIDLNTDGIAYLVNDDANFTVTDEFSVATWIYLEGTPTAFANYITRQEGAGDFEGWAMATGGTSNRDKLAFVLRQDGSNNYTIQTAESVPTGRWVRVLACYDGTTASKARIYFDGREVETTQTTSTLSDAEDITTAAGVPITIGGRDAVASNPGVGYRVDCVRVYPIALTPEQAGLDYEEAEPNDAWTLGFYSSYLSAVSSNDWLGRSDMLELVNGNWLHFYRASTSHESAIAANWHLQFSNDQGATWTANDTLLGGGSTTGTPFTVINTDDSPHDLALVQASNGDVLAFVSYYDGQRWGTHVWRSTDNGETWADDGQMTVSGLYADGIVAGGQCVVVDGDLYFCTWYDPTPTAPAAPHQTIILKSTNNGTSWTKLCDVTSTSDNTGEPGIVSLGDGNMLVVCKDNAGETYTYMATVTTSGTVGTLTEIQSQVGVLQRPKLFTIPTGVLLVGREETGTGEITVFYTSKDGGTTWSEQFYLDPFEYEDAGYVGLVVNTRTIHGFSYRGTDNDSELVEFELTYDGLAASSDNTLTIGGVIEPTISTTLRPTIQG